MKYWCGYCGSQKEDNKTKIGKFPLCDKDNHFMKPVGMRDRRKKLKHPCQPLEDDGNLVLRFKENAVVQYLMEEYCKTGRNLNNLYMQNFSNEDLEQFNQLTGYSLSGYGELNVVSNKTYKLAEKSAEKAIKRIEKIWEQGAKSVKSKRTISKSTK